jgi:hypothetical protein
MKVPLEYQQSTLEFLNCLMTGLSYLCIYNILLETAQGKVGDDNLASLEREVSNCMYVVKDVLKSNKTLKKLFKELNEDATAKYYEFGINCLVRMANSFEIKHAEAKTKGYIGAQYAYLNEALILLKAMDNDSFNDKKALQKKFEGLKKKADEVKTMIDQVYQCPIPPRDQLKDIKPIEQKVRPMEPKNIRIPPKDAQYFSGFASEEMETTRSSLSLFLTNKKQHAEKTLFDLKEQLLSMNRTYNIPFLKNCASLSTTLINDEFKKKILAIKTRGESAFPEMLNQEAMSRKLIEKQFEDLDRIINKEVEQDKSALQLAGQGGYTTFVQAFQDQLTNLNNIKGAYRTYKAISEKLVSSHERFKGWLGKLANPNLNVEDLVKIPDLDAFVQANAEDIATLKKLSDGIETVIYTHIRSDFEAVMHVLNEIDVETLTQKISMNEKNLETIYKDINERLGPLSLTFEEKVFRF